MQSQSFLTELIQFKDETLLPFKCVLTDDISIDNYQEIIKEK